MKKKKTAKRKMMVEDGDDAHFSDNPSVEKKTKKHRGAAGKRRVKSYSKSSSFNTIYGKPQKSPKKTSGKKVFVKQ